MPDVGRSDSQRSDSSLRPRVSFNRDVHVKRIGPRSLIRSFGISPPEDPNVIQDSPTAPVRKQRLGRLTRHELEQEAARVVQQADSIQCSPLDKFYTLPARRKHRHSSNSPHGSQERRNSDDSNHKTKAVTRSASDASSLKKTKKQTRGSLFGLFKRSDKESSSGETKKTTLGRSKSDVSDKKSHLSVSDDTYATKPLRKRSGSDSEGYFNSIRGLKTPLTPIIENSPPVVDSTNDYFRLKNIPTNQDTVDNVVVKEEPVKLENSEDSVQSAKKAKIVDKKSKKSSPNVLVKDFISGENVTRSDGEGNITKIIKDAIDCLENISAQEKTEDMIHSSQKPTQKPPLTKGNTVDHMVKVLSNGRFSPPPKTHLLLSSTAMQHNNNQPFSYTQPSSISPNPNLYTHPTSENLPHPPNQIIYAQVVCNNDGNKKQTIHTSFTKPKNLSDEDEGLGFETINKNSGSFGDRYNIVQAEDPYKSLSDYNADLDTPITPNLKELPNDKYIHDSFGLDRYDKNYKKEHNIFVDSARRGRGDGMDFPRRESLTEKHLGKMNGVTSDLSHRRDLLESRLNSRRINDSHNQFGSGEKMHIRYSPEIERPITTSKYVSESTSKYYREGAGSPVGFTEKYKTETRVGKDGKPHTTESRSRSQLNEHDARKVIDIDRREFLDSHLNHDSSHRYLKKVSDYIESQEPRSLDSQISDYRSSPENITKTHVVSSENISGSGRYIHSNKYKNHKNNELHREHYQSNPEILHTPKVQQKYVPETYHNSLRRDKHGNSKRHYKTTSYFNQESTGNRYDRYDNERKEKFADSGIENDYRKDSNGEISSRNNSNRNFQTSRNKLVHESEDEGFASLLLIASERRHTEDNINRDRDIHVLGDRRREIYLEDLRNMNGLKRENYAHRERSIDDGSHFDPRIDKLDKTKESGTMKKKESKIERKPPKGERKLTGLEKVKQLFTRDSTKKVKKEQQKILDREIMVRDEDLRARYSEYKGSSETLDGPPNDHHVLRDIDRQRKDEAFDYSLRRRLSTPSASPSPPRRTRNAPENKSAPHASSTPVATRDTNGGWFKSLDRLARRGKNKSVIKKEDSVLLTTEDEAGPITSKQSANLSTSYHNISSAPRKPPRRIASPAHLETTPTKNLRFFGDTDMESNASISKQRSVLKSRPVLNGKTNTLSRTGKKYSQSAHALDAIDHERVKSSSMTSLQQDGGGGTSQNGRQNLLLNSYNKEKYSNSHRNLHNISETQSQSETESICEERERKLRSEMVDRIDKKPPVSPAKDNRKNPTAKNLAQTRGSRSDVRKSKSDLRDNSRERTDSRRRRPRDYNGNSSVESSTEGDSSQQSQRSVVYLHAATVGDIPGPTRMKKRATSREELSSVASSKMQPQVKTVSRSISVLAPWKPRHPREGIDINYSETQNRALRGQKSPNSSSLISNETNPKRTANSRNKVDNSTMSRRSKDAEEKKNSTGTLYRKNKDKDRSSKENVSERIRSKENVNITNSKIKTAPVKRNKIDATRKSGSMEVLSARRLRDEDKRENISRSMSIPKDNSKGAGWFKIAKKSKK